MANAAQEKKNYHFNDGYVETNDILMALIGPKVDEQIKKKYHKSLIWNPGDIENIKYFGNADGETWYEMDMVVFIGDPKDANLERVKIKIDVPKVNHETP